VATCAFCEIAAEETPASLVFHDDVSLAFLDRRPLFPGHVLLIPRRHVQTLDELPLELVQPLFARARCLSRMVERAMEAEGTFVAMNNRVSQSVPHLHIHIVPRKKKDGLRGFFWPRNPYRNDAHQESVRKQLADAWPQAWQSGQSL
jgi:histidine triad (HIT) family protein